MKCLHNESLLKHNSFNIETTCADIYYPESICDLESLPSLDNTPFYILGEGSNTLFTDEKSPTIIKPNFKGLKVSDKGDCYCVHVGASENWHDLVSFCIKQNIFGLENLALIPGSVGAAPVQNIGAYGVDFSDYCYEVEWFNLKTRKVELLSKNECEFGYRDSIFKGALYNKGIIIGATLHFPKKWQANLAYSGLDSLPSDSIAADVMAKVIELRMSKLPDPTLLPNAGSFFKNPVVDGIKFKQLQSQYPNMPSYKQTEDEIKLAAGWLIDQAGLKGYRIGKVGIHDKQALVLVNYNSGSGQEIVSLAQLIQERVLTDFGVIIEPEVRTVTEKGEVKFSNLSIVQMQETS